LTPPAEDFRGRAQRLLHSREAGAIGHGTDRFQAQREAAAVEYAGWAPMRERAAEIRRHTIDHLGYYLARFAENVETAGGQVHIARSPAEAVGLVGSLVGPGRLMVKSKSMLSEEVGLNRAMIEEGIEVVETDLGELIIQLAADSPSHIIAPAMHLTRQEVGELFRDRLGAEYTEEPAELNRIARQHLRPIFLAADVGVTGVNFGVAESGSLVTVTNEGNARLVSTTPPIHIALMGIERIVPTFGDLAVMLEVLARSATGQRLSAYTSIITGPRRPGEPDGPEQLHVILVDNGRSQLLDGDYAEILSCIRCGACLNACPVYRQTGGHAYGSVYPGPVGAVLTPLLYGLPRWGELAYASTLCGACLEVCPVSIDIPRMLLSLRQEEAAAGRVPGRVASSVRIFSLAAAAPRRLRRFWRWLRWTTRPFTRDGWVRWLPGPGARWTEARSLRRLPSLSFRDRWRRRG
jgi:L-lactate dehydrogenase complex protein LldF